MDSRKIIYERFIKPFENKTSRDVGVELEFPIVNTSGGDTDVRFVSEIAEFLEKHGFNCVLFGEGGEKLFMENECGDCLSFDNSYNNFEFSLNHCDNLCELHGRFEKYFELVSGYFKKGGHRLASRGTNPNFNNLSVNHAPFSTYNMVQNYLHTYMGEHCYPDFPAFMSSVQTHLDIQKDKLPFAYTLFARLDFVRGILFHNSPDFNGEGYRIFRDYLWEKSGFGRCPNITGAVDESFETTDDIISFFLKKGLFNRIRNGKYEIFDPILIEDYFKRDDARAEDIECFLSFRNVEITCRGTLEVRSDCTQKEGRHFAPPAFNLGVLQRLDEAKARLDEFFKVNDITLSNSQLREIVSTGKDLSLIANQKEIDSLCGDLTDIARDGLVARNKGEENLLITNV